MSDTTPDQLTYEEAREELIEVVRTLEAGGTTLEESLALWERGEALAKQEGRLRTHDFVGIERTNYPLTLVAAPAERLFLRLAYPEGRFDDTSVRRALGHLARVLGGMVDSLARPVAELPLWSEGERQQVEREWSMAGGAAEFFWVFERFAAAAGKRPDSVAVVDGGRHVSYGELARQAGELGTELRRRGVGPEAAVAVRRSRRMARSLLEESAGAEDLPGERSRVHPAGTAGCVEGTNRRRGPWPRTFAGRDRARARPRPRWANRRRKHARGGNPLQYLPADH